MPKRYAIGVIHYRSYDDLKACLDSIERQEHAPECTLVVDVDSDEDRQRDFHYHANVEWEHTRNGGYSVAANLAIRILCERTDADYILLLNPDVRLDAQFSKRLIEEMHERPRVALGTGKLMRPEGVIDSAGIELPRHRRPRDRGSEQQDRGQFERTELVFGASGAAMMLRISALAELAIDGEVFDEDFFLYHEDTDLCWRAQRLGWQVLYVPEARACHNRSWRRDRRFEIASQVRRHSFKNHYLQLIKNERPRDFWRNLPVIATWELLRLGFAILRDPSVLPGYLEAGRLAPNAWRKRRLLESACRERLEAYQAGKT